MKIEDIIFDKGENKNSRDFLLSALCSLAFEESVSLGDITKDGENNFSVQERKHNIFYWWFAGLKDILHLSSHEQVVIHKAKLDIDKYCEVLKDFDSFSIIAETARDNRNFSTKVDESKDYYLYNSEKCYECYESLDNYELLQKINQVKSEYRRIIRETNGNIWRAVIQSYPAQRILGKKISDIGSKETTVTEDNFKIALSNSTVFLMNDSVSYVDEEFSFLSGISAILDGDKLRYKQNSKKKQLLDVVHASFKKDAVFLDRNTGNMRSVDSMISIDSSLEEFLRNKSEVVEDAKIPDLNKCMSDVSNLESLLFNLSDTQVNLISVLDFEPNCDSLIYRLNKFAEKCYGKTDLMVIESKVFGTEQKAIQNSNCRGMILSLYNSFENICNENILYVSHLLKKTMKIKKKLKTNEGGGLFKYSDTFSNIAGKNLEDYLDSLEGLREIIREVGNVNRINMHVYFDNGFGYLYDISSQYYDRAVLPKFKASSDSELYLPVPITKTSDNDNIARLKVIAQSMKSFDKLRQYSKKIKKPLSDVYYYNKGKSGKSNTLLNIHEKSGGIFNFQNDKNEFADMEKVYSIEELVRSNDIGKSILPKKSLIMAEDYEDQDYITLSQILSDLESTSMSKDSLSFCKDGGRRAAITLLNGKKIKEDKLVSLFDIYCERPNRLSAYLQGFVWRTGYTYSKYESGINELFFKDNSKYVINNGCLRTEYFDYTFMTRNGGIRRQRDTSNSITYYMSFCNWHEISKSSPETLRLFNFEYLEMEDFLGVENFMYEFVLPCIIELEDGEVLESMQLGTNAKSERYTIVMDKYVRIGAKLSWLVFHYKLNGDSGIYDLFNLINEELNFDEFGKDFRPNFFRLCRLKCKQLALLLAKSCMYSTDLVELCKIFRDLVCGILGKSDKVIGTKNDYRVSDLVSYFDFDTTDKVVRVMADQSYLSFLSNNMYRSAVVKRLKEEGYEDLGNGLDNNKLPSRNTDEGMIVYKYTVELFCTLANYRGEDCIFEVLNQLDNQGCLQGDLVYNVLALDRLVENILRNFEEVTGDDLRDPYFLLSKNNDRVTDLIVEKDSGIGRFYACNYACNLLNKVYATMGDIGGDCYLLNSSISKDFSGDPRTLVLNRNAFYITYRKILMEKLLRNYSKIKSEVSEIKGSFSKDDLVKLHTTLMLPESTKSVIDRLEPSEVITYFCYIINKSRNGVKDFKEYISKVFVPNENKVKEIAYPDFGKKMGSNFSLGSDIISEINRIASSIRCVKKFQNSAVDLLRNAVKDTGLYNSLDFRDGIAIKSDGTPLILYSFKTNLSNSKASRKSDVLYAYVLHESGMFFQIDYSGKNIIPIDTVVNVTTNKGLEYLNSISHSKDYSNRDIGLFESSGPQGIGIVDKYSKSIKVMEVMVSQMMEITESITKAKKYGLIKNDFSPKGMLESRNTELSIVEGSNLVAIVDNDTINELKGGVNRIKEVLDLMTNGSDNLDINGTLADMVDTIANSNDVITETDVVKIIRNVILASKDIEQESERLGVSDGSREEQEIAVIDDTLEKNFDVIGQVFDTKLDMQKYVTDLQMYSSIWPNTVH